MRVATILKRNKIYLYEIHIPGNINIMFTKEHCEVVPFSLASNTTTVETKNFQFVMTTVILVTTSNILLIWILSQYIYYSLYYHERNKNEVNSNKSTPPHFYHQSWTVLLVLAIVKKLSIQYQFCKSFHTKSCANNAYIA